MTTIEERMAEGRKAWARLMQMPDPGEPQQYDWFRDPATGFAWLYNGVDWVPLRPWLGFGLSGGMNTGRDEAMNDPRRAATSDY